MTRAKFRRLRKIGSLAKGVKGIRSRTKAVARSARLGLMRCETPTAAWIDGQTNWAVARLRSGLSARRPKRSHPVVESLQKVGYAKAEGLLDPVIVEQVYGAFLAKISDQDRVKRITNPDSTHPEFAGKVSITKSPNKFREALALFGDDLCRPIFEFFQCDFYIAMAEAFRIHALPEGAEAYRGSYYSEDWHLDSFQEADTLKVFVPLHPVADADGPTEILDLERSRYIMRERAAGRLRRNNDHVQIAVKQTAAWTTMTGRPGDVYFARTNYCYHRATSPASGRHRDILIFRLRPWHPWTLSPDRLFEGRVRHLRPVPKGDQA